MHTTSLCTHGWFGRSGNFMSKGKQLWKTGKTLKCSLLWEISMQEQWCSEKDLCITNTWFAKPEKNQWTWASANGRCLNQIDYILAPKRIMCSVLDSSTAVRADCGSIYNPLVVKLRIKLKLPCKETKKKLPDWDNISPKTVEEIHGTLEEILGNVKQLKMLIEQTYGIFVRAINETSECIPKARSRIENLG